MFSQRRSAYERFFTAKTLGLDFGENFDKISEAHIAKRLSQLQKIHHQVEGALAQISRQQLRLEMRQQMFERELALHRREMEQNELARPERERQKQERSGAQATPKGLRHGFAIHALLVGVRLNMLQKWLGHADIKTTAIYIDASGAEETEIADRMGNLSLLPVVR